MSDDQLFCWCDMCGLNAMVKKGLTLTTEDQIECPDCSDVGMFSFLEFGHEIPDHVAQDDPMDTYPYNSKQP